MGGSLLRLSVLQLAGLEEDGFGVEVERLMGERRGNRT